MPSGDQKIVILLAAFNGAEQHCRTTKVLCRAARQNWELVVSDDGSTDRTVEIVRPAATGDPKHQGRLSCSRLAAATPSVGFLLWKAQDVDRSPLDILAPILMSCAILWWIGRRMSWARWLVVTAITIAVIILVLLLERGWP